MSPASLAIAQARDAVNNASTLPARMELLRDAIQSLLSDAAWLRRGQATLDDTAPTRTHALQVVQTVAVPGAFIVAGEDVDSFLRHLRTDAFAAASPAVVGMSEAEFAAARSRLLDAQNKLWTWQPDARETSPAASPTAPETRRRFTEEERLELEDTALVEFTVLKNRNVSSIARKLRVNRPTLMGWPRFKKALEKYRGKSLAEKSSRAGGHRPGGGVDDD